MPSPLGRPASEIEEGTAQATTEQRTADAAPRKPPPPPVSARKSVSVALPGHVPAKGMAGGEVGVQIEEGIQADSPKSEVPVGSPRPMPTGRPLRKSSSSKESGSLLGGLLGKLKRGGGGQASETLYLTPAEVLLVPDEASRYLDHLPALAEAAFGVNKQVALRNLMQLDEAWGESRRRLLEAGVAAGLVPEEVAHCHDSVTVAPAKHEGGGVFISVPKWVTSRRSSSGSASASPRTPERAGQSRGRGAARSPVAAPLPTPAGRAGRLPPLEASPPDIGREGEVGGQGGTPTGQAPVLLVPVPPPGEPRPRHDRRFGAGDGDGGAGGDGGRGEGGGGGGEGAEEEDAAALEAFHEMAAVFGRDTDPLLEPLLGPVAAHVDAANARVMRGAWEAPYLFDAQVFSGRRPLPEGASSRLADEYRRYTRAAVGALREGRVAVHLLATGEEVALPGGSRVSLYNVDPYDLADAMRGGAGGAADPVSYGGAGSLLRGLAFGPRHLLKLTQQVQKVVGSRGMDQMCVVLHVGPDTEAAAAEDLVQRQFYGMRPENVLVVVQPRLPAYTYSAAEGGMVPDPGGWHELGGTGYAMRQLEWPEQAYVLSADGRERSFLRGSVLGYLEASGREWLASNRINDAYRYTDVVLDVDALAVTLMCRQEMGACMSVEVEEVRRADAGAGAPVVMQRPGAAGFSSELRASCVRLPDVRQQLADVFEAEGGVRVPRSTRRAFYLVPHLRSLLRRPGAMVPELAVDGRALHIRQDMSDLSMQPDAHCVALLGLEPLLCLEGPADLAETMRVIRSMDSDAGFHQLAARLSSRQAPVAVRPSGVAQRHQVLMLARDNESSRKAFALIVPLLTPGLDSLRLVTGVERPGDIPHAQKMLAGFVPPREHGLVEVRRDVVLLPQDPGAMSKSEVFKRVATDMGATLVVVGSERGRRGGAGGAGSRRGAGWARMGLPLGSTALAMLSGAPASALVVKDNAWVGPGYSADAGSLMLGVDPAGGCLEALGLVLSLARRRDKCCVVRHEVVSANEAERRHVDRLVFDLEEQGLALGKRVVKRVAEGHSWAEAVATCAASERVDVLAVAAPAAPAPVPPEVLEVAVKAWGAVLVVKPGAGGGGGGG